jgi:hypothetical protein
MKQTAVEWLEFRYKNNINLMDYDFEQAKEMEKQQQEQDKKLYSELVDLLERLTTIYKEDCDLDIKYDKKRLEFIEQFKNK